jgi:hypothetical protein
MLPCHKMYSGSINLINKLNLTNSVSVQPRSQADYCLNSHSARIPVTDLAEIV